MIRTKEELLTFFFDTLTEARWTLSQPFPIEYPTKWYIKDEYGTLIVEYWDEPTSEDGKFYGWREAAVIYLRKAIDVEIAKRRGNNA